MPHSFSFSCDTWPHFMHCVSCILNILSEALRGTLPFSSSSWLLVMTEVNYKGYMDFLSKHANSRFIPKLWSIEYHQNLEPSSLHLQQSPNYPCLKHRSIDNKDNLWTIFSVLILSLHNVDRYSYPIFI